MKKLEHIHFVGVNKSHAPETLAYAILEDEFDCTWSDRLVLRLPNIKAIRGVVDWESLIIWVPLV